MHITPLVRAEEYDGPRYAECVTSPSNVTTLTVRNGSKPLTLIPKQALVFTRLQDKSFENSLRAIPPFPTVFSTLLENFLPFSKSYKLSSANPFGLEESCLFGRNYS